MLRTSQNKPGLAINQITDRIIANGRITRNEHILLTSAILSDKLTDYERYQINRIFDYLRFGKIKIVN